MKEAYITLKDDEAKPGQEVYGITPTGKLLKGFLTNVRVGQRDSYLLNNATNMTTNKFIGDTTQNDENKITELYILREPYASLVKSLTESSLVKSLTPLTVGGRKVKRTTKHKRPNTKVRAINKRHRKTHRVSM
jgi:hypothetical protein